MRKIRFQRGGGTFLEFTITSVMLTSILLMIVNIFMQKSAMETFELYAAQIAREIVVCDSLEEAQKKAEKEAERLFGNIRNIYGESIVVEVEYALGSDEEWKKGNYIILTMTGDIIGHSYFVPAQYQTNNMVMIEKEG